MKSLKGLDFVEKLGVGKKEHPVWEKRDYQSYRWRKKNLFWEIGKCTGIVLVVSIYFYKSLWAALPLCALGGLCFQRDSKRMAKQTRRKLLLQFRDMIRSVATAMAAGYSVENAFLESYGDMCLMHGKEAMICEELRILQRGLVMNMTMEELLEDFGRRSHVEQIAEFATIFTVAKRNGASMGEVIRSSSDLIQKRVDTEEEILIQTAGRRMEQRIMNMMPFLILTYIGMTNKGYFDMLYHNVTGVVIMSVCLAVYLAAYGMSEAILAKTLCVWD